LEPKNYRMWRSRVFIIKADRFSVDSHSTSSLPSIFTMSDTAPPPSPVEQLANSRTLRLFRADEKAITDLHREFHPSTEVQIVDIIRMCVRAGLPLVKKAMSQQHKEDNGHS